MTQPVIANLATYPPRRASLLPVVQAIAPQVDQLNIVLNQYDAPLAELDGFANVHQIVPEEDTKDVGKFLPDVADADLVFLIDDDLIYPSDYIATSVKRFTEIGPARKAAGYHCSIYRKARFSMRPKDLRKWWAYSDALIADYRDKDVFHNETAQARYVDQIATNSAIIRGCDMPSFDYMKDSQKFVDVRLAAWLFDRGIPLVSLPKSKDWLREVKHEETIAEGFTKTNPPHVTTEIFGFAFKRPEAGKPVT